MALKIDVWNLIPLLEDVDSELPAGTHIEIVVVGGAVMVLKRTYRFTYDVDSITVIPPLLAAAAERVADRHGLSSDWLDDLATTIKPRNPPSSITTLYDGNRLKVRCPDSSYLLAMKVVAGRDQDIEDSVVLMEEVGVRSTPEILELVREAYGTDEPVRGVRSHAVRAVEELARRSRPCEAGDGRVH